MTAFMRLLEAEGDAKSTVLQRTVQSWRSGGNPACVFHVTPSSFGLLPGAPFAYWIGDSVRFLFAKLPKLESGGRVAHQGLSTGDDFQWLRLWWEVAARDFTRSALVPLAKGGSFSRYYADLHLAVRWGASGHGLKAWKEERLRVGAITANNSKCWNESHYFRPGVTWPRRTDGLSFRAMPAGSILGDKGPAVMEPKNEASGLLATMALGNSLAFRSLLQARLARTELAQSFEVGLIKSMPYPPLTHEQCEILEARAREGWSLQRKLDLASQTSHAFTVPEAFQVDGPTLRERTRAWSSHLAKTNTALATVESAVDDLAFELYGIAGEDRRQMEEGFGALGSSGIESAAAAEDKVEGADPVALTEAVLEWALGVALGRFDLRLATGEREPPPDPEPFDPLPVCSPGMLQDDAGLPSGEAPTGYPLELPPHGILVDDLGHPWDAVSRMEAVLDLVAGEDAHSWIHEAEDLLGRDLRDWLRRYGFERHLKLYSKSRRKAPLFWHLAPKSREYGIWLYSPVATRDTLYRILNDHVDPKLKGSERRLLELRQDAGESPTTQQRRELASQESLVEELRALREEVARVAPLWAPCRDDGVVLNCAVLWRLFDHHRAWQKECKKKWGELARGKYEWAGWAMHLWPERVVSVCAKDRSIAVAHGLEEALWVEGDDGKWKPRKDAEEQVARLTDERRSAALAAALDDFTRAM